MTSFIILVLSLVFPAVLSVGARSTVVEPGRKTLGVYLSDSRRLPRSDGVASRLEGSSRAVSRTVLSTSVPRLKAQAFVYWYSGYASLAWRPDCDSSESLV